ncbi:hypothetical protein CLOBOL_02132 [Enterocloster bolteae ATCC BAA-613]|uniref:Uncharacterized protein n=1 Tax=Enterocloster bolteae (strain ATCC BAA-613 / DSM 15670 / CCUG 46953 / JCM 12243 / WAL 16351) TaxID=411902 RepID=A8RN87_ENTBW|nr:hypothetical protein CLOBOL_02132 [Enterocloster bolteae ATCC BAA-613]
MPRMKNCMTSASPTFFGKEVLDSNFWRMVIRNSLI